MAARGSRAAGENDSCWGWTDRLPRPGLSHRKPQEGGSAGAGKPTNMDGPREPQEKATEGLSVIRVGSTSEK